MNTFIFIGRDAASSALNINVNNNAQVVGAPGSVPKSVSRQHCQLTINDDGSIHLKNINPQNTTFVNGVAVMSKTVTRGDKVELGGDRYLLNWNLIDKAMPKEADIRPLKAVWETYINETKAVTQSRQRFQTLRGIVPVLTMSAVLIGYLSGGRGIVFLAIYAIVIALTIFFVIKSWKDIPKDEEQMKEIKDRLTQNYCCPECGYFFGFQEYSILSRNIDYCPRCKTKLKKK